MYLYNLKQNAGKAEAIRQTMNHILDSEIYSEYKWIGFFDADLATPIWEIKNFFSYAQTYELSIDAIWGSRIYRLGSKIVRSSLRHYLGRIFATVIGMVLRIKSYDSQCGAKVFKRELCEKGFREPFLSKWIFDVELLLRLEGSNIIEYPLRSWQDIPGSKLKVGKEIFRVLFDIFKIWKKYRAK
jgi:dolichyl-phosphate beta-glucosyltransferase